MGAPPNWVCSGTSTRIDEQQPKRARTRGTREGAKEGLPRVVGFDEVLRLWRGCMLEEASGACGLKEYMQVVHGLVAH